jgi:hypothetical protein
MAIVADVASVAGYGVMRQVLYMTAGQGVH